MQYFEDFTEKGNSYVPKTRFLIPNSSWSLILQSRCPTSLLGGTQIFQVMHQLKLVVLFFISSVVCSVVVISGQNINKSLAINSTSTNSQQGQGPQNLKAAIIVNNSSSASREMTLFSYSTDEGNYLTGLNYPVKPRMSFTMNSYIRITSGNPTFKIIPTEIALYKNGDNDNPLYPQPAAGGQWFVNVPPGIYRLQVNTEYTPSNDDVATFVDTIQVLGTGKISEGSQLMTTPGNNDAGSIQTQQKQQSPTALAGSFKVIVQVNGINKDKHDKIIFVTGNPSLYPLKFMQSRLIHYDFSIAGISSTYSTTFDLSKDTVKTGEKFMACLLSLQPFLTPTYREPVICKIGVNSPASKPEIVIFSMGELMPSETLVK